MIDILAIGTYPGDIEIGCGGILAAMSKKNRRILAVDLVPGAASHFLNHDRISLDFSPNDIADTYEGRVKLVEVLRTYQPKLVLAPHWEESVAGQMMRYACRFARFAKILPSHPIHRPDGILHYLFPFQTFSADVIMDVSGSIEEWKSLIEMHCLKEAVIQVSACFGIMMGVEYAQVLVKGNPIVVNELMDISRGTMEI